MSTEKLKTWLLVTVGLLVLLFLLLAWPTLYRYDNMGSYLVRTNRLTGKSQMLGGLGWRDMAPVKVPPFAAVQEDDPQARQQLIQTAAASVAISKLTPTAPPNARDK